MLDGAEGVTDKNIEKYIKNEIKREKIKKVSIDMNHMRRKGEGGKAVGRER